MTDHIFYTCKKPCTKQHCNFCDGGLRVCTVCGQAEAELGLTCPGTRDPVLDDKDRGMYNKYDVRRCDGSSGEGQKHENCEYFVLDLEHDPYARAALLAYATACESTHPVLARDIRIDQALRRIGRRVS